MHKKSSHTNFNFFSQLALRKQDHQHCHMHKISSQRLSYSPGGHACHFWRKRQFTKVSDGTIRKSDDSFL